MLKNLIKISWRLIKRNRTYSIINFFGLSLGLFVFILIYLYVSYEQGFDTYHKNYNAIYRVYKQAIHESKEYNFPAIEAPLVNLVKQQLPEAEYACRVAGYSTLLVKIGDEPFLEKQYYAADPDLFKIFTLETAAGNPRKQLENPNSIILNETLARKYFGTAENAIGKTIEVESSHRTGAFVVETVIKDMPDNSHFKLNIIFQFEALVKAAYPVVLTSWQDSFCYNYLTLKPGSDAAVVERKLMAAIRPHIGKRDNSYKLQPLSEIYLDSRFDSDLASHNSISRIFIFSCIGVLVLLIACINYTNMATARASSRAKEIGLRKVTGAKRSQLMVQFISEAVLVTTVSMILAYVAVKAVLPYFNSFLDKNIILNIQTQPMLVILLISLTAGVGILAGLYPAMILSRLNPSITLKGKFTTSGNLHLRDALVVFQFIVSGALIFATIVIWRQMDYVENKDLGYNKEQIVIIQLRDNILRNKAEVIKEKLLKHRDIVNVSASSRPPSQIVGSMGRKWQTKEGEKDLEVYYGEIDSSFFDVYEIKLLAGRNLSSTSHRNDVVINESLVKELGYTNEEIVGMLFSHWDSSYVIGVVKDFHFQDFKQKIQPLRLKKFVMGPPNYLSLKINDANMQHSLRYVEETLEAISDKYPFEYYFYDDIYYRAYTSELKTAKLMGWFSGVAILIATLGLYGLVLFTLNQRVREISIRKVLGASGISIARLLSSHFVMLVIIGYTIACGAGYYFMQKWLNEFAYKIPLGFNIFLLTLLIMVAITGLTLFLRVRQATLVNPAEVLKQE